MPNFLPYILVSFLRLLSLTTADCDPIQRFFFASSTKPTMLAVPNSDAGSTYAEKLSVLLFLR